MTKILNMLKSVPTKIQAVLLLILIDIQCITLVCSFIYYFWLILVSCLPDLRADRLCNNSFKTFTFIGLSGHQILF